tara:strand:- start:501 stop:1247 length:747 start_codon:yes stop_codon:yes gene_type:complete
MTENSFVIKPYHWWLTICVAVVLHLLLFLNYRQDEVEVHEHANTDLNEVVIGLKKIKSPPIIEKPGVVETVEVKPAPVKQDKPKPVIKKKKIPKPKPIVKSTPKVTSPPVNPAQVAPLEAVRKETSPRQERVTTTSSQSNVNDVSASAQHEKAQYYSQLATWLERHKKYPTVARRRNQQGKVTIKFVLDKEGRLMSYQLSKASKYNSLNTATIKMLQRASPMPVPPKALMGDRNELEFTIPVNFNLVE